MNTQTSNIWHQNFKNKEQYLALRAKWKDLHDEGKLKDRPWAYLLYSILRGKDWRKNFSPNSHGRTIEHAFGCISFKLAQWLLGDEIIDDPIRFNEMMNRIECKSSYSSGAELQEHAAYVDEVFLEEAVG